MRIGLNIPDELLARLEPLKPSINVSQICREAIEAYVDSYERASMKIEDDGALHEAERIWRQHESKTVDWEELGYVDGKAWVERAELEDLENLFHNLGVAKRKNREPFIPFWRYIPDTKDFGHRRGEHAEWFIWQGELDETGNPYIRAEKEYTRGWLAYVTAVWQQVDQWRRAHTKEMVDQRESRAQPEVPERLVSRVRDSYARDDLIKACLTHGHPFTLYGPIGEIHQGHCRSHGHSDGACERLVPYLRLTAALELWRVTVVECGQGCLKYFLEGQRHGWPILESFETLEPIHPQDRFDGTDPGDAP